MYYLPAPLAEFSPLLPLVHLIVGLGAQQAFDLTDLEAAGIIRLRQYQPLASR
jgi:hypothetical protein